MRFQQITAVAFGRMPWFYVSVFFVSIAFNLWGGETLGSALIYCTLLVAWLRLSEKFDWLLPLSLLLLGFLVLWTIKDWATKAQMTWQQVLGATGVAVMFVLPLCAIMLWLDRVLKPWVKRSGQRFLGTLILIVLLGLFWSIYIVATCAFLQWQPQFSPFSPKG